MNLAFGRTSSGRLVVLGFALALLAMLVFGGRAQAAETLYWNNYGDNPDTLGFSGIDGNGGGQLSTGSEMVESPEGMAYDTVTNRLFLTTGSGAARHILAVNLDGSGASVFTAPGAPVEEPEGIAVDPATRTIYWQNTKGEGSIAWARLDGSGGSLLSTAGVTLDDICCRIAVDPVGGRVYFVNGSDIAYVNTNNSGGGELSLTGTTVVPGGEGLAVDPAAGRIYFLGSVPGDEGIGYANLNNSGGGEVSLGTAPMNGSWGLAFDPSISRLYWGNESNGEVRADAFGFVNLAGAGGGISVATAPIANPQDPVILKSPTGTGAPTIIRNPKVPAELTCSTGSWGADYAGSFVYQAPRSFTYQWSSNGTAISGATAATLTTTTAGQYACTVTAINQAGSATQNSAVTPVKASKVKLSTKKKAKADPGDLVTFKVKIVNQGDVSSRAARICVKLPNAAKDDLRKPKCKKLAPVNGLVKRTTKFRIKVKPGADEGADKLTFQVKGTPGKAAKSKIIVR